MKEIEIRDAQKATSPNSVVLLSATKGDGTENLAVFSWWTYLANNPPMLGIALSTKCYSCELVKTNKKFALSIPGEAIAEAAFKCGTVSGRDTNKIQDFAIEMETLPGAAIKTPIHSKLVFMCTLEEMQQAGDHIFFIAKIDKVFYNEKEKQVYSWDGYKSLKALS